VYRTVGGVNGGVPSPLLALRDLGDDIRVDPIAFIVAPPHSGHLLY
jgi:hypothetical protein